jgi:hypothetical protein
MKRIIITIDDETAKVLAREKNQSAAVRDALKVYQSDVPTDTIGAMRTAFTALRKKQEDHEKMLADRFAVFDESFARLDKLVSYLETRM